VKLEWQAVAPSWHLDPKSGEHFFMPRSIRMIAEHVLGAERLYNERWYTSLVEFSREGIEIAPYAIEANMRQLAKMTGQEMPSRDEAARVAAAWLLTPEATMPDPPKPG